MKTKMIIIVSGIFLFALAGTLGFHLGSMHAAYSSDQHVLSMNERTKGLTRRTEAYEPSCGELNHTGIPRLAEHESDYFFVHVEENYFHVFGVNVDPGKPPVMTWWGGGRHAALESCKDR